MEEEELSNSNNFLFYTTNDGKTKIQVITDGKSVWTTQRGMGEVFGTSRENITLHLSNIFKENELLEDSVCKEILHTAADGKRYKTRFYNLDAIISVGYRVSSYQATQFRKWATGVLNEYLIKGFTLDDERLKQGSTIFGKDYFQELLERIKEIRASERRFYQKITDIYAQCSSDYDPNSPISQTFFATVQNKLEFAITHKTASEIVKSRADHKAPNMGLTTWKNAPNGKVLKTDITIAKNYLNKDEMSELNNIVNMYLDYAELQARRNRLMKMSDWVRRMDDFLQFNEYDLLKNSGSVTAKFAKSFAEKQYAKFRVIQDKNFQSDFDKISSRIIKNGSIPEADKSGEHNPENKKPDTFKGLLGAIAKVKKPDKPDKPSKEDGDDDDDAILEPVN